MTALETSIDRVCGQMDIISDTLALPIQAGRGNRWLNRNDGRSEVRHVASGLVAYKLVYVAQIQETRWTADGLSC